VDRSRSSSPRFGRARATSAFRCRLRRRDGSYILVDWRCGPRDRAGLVLAVGRDVTNETLLHERLRASEARVRALSDGSPIGVYETDCRGALVYANDRMLTIWDVTHSELSDGSWIERVLPSDAARFAAWLQDPAGRASSGKTPSTCSVATARHGTSGSAPCRDWMATER
jgi:PAS domain-containing protein